MSFDSILTCNLGFAYNTIGILISIALTGTGLGLLTTGLVYTNRGIWIIDKNECQNVYISGILMTFIIGTYWTFALLFCLVGLCEKPVVVTNPLNRRRSSDETTGRSKSSPRLSPRLSPKKKNSPIRVLIV
jgi:hypothetical protein